MYEQVQAGRSMPNAAAGVAGDARARIQVYGSAQMSGVDRVLLLDETAQSIEGANKGLSECIAEMRTHLDSLLGSEPSENVGADKMGGLEGRVHGIRSLSGGTHNLIAQLRNEIQRLRRL